MWPPNEETQQLILHAQQGDREAVSQLLDRHRAALRRMIELRLDRQIRRRVDASDVVQEVLWEANRRLAKYLEDPAIPFHIWLRTIAQDRLIDAHRRHRVSGKRSVEREQHGGTASVSSQAITALLQDPELTPAAAATAKELEEAFWAALEQLNEGDHEIILLRHFEQLSNQEAATALGLSEPAASMRYLRAMRRLRAVLEAAGHEEGGG